jgi:biotin transport system substrate-specific component
MGIEKIKKNAVLSRSFLSTREMVYCALFAVLTGVGANLRVPLPQVPLTLQTLFVSMAGLILGARRGAVSMAMYMLLGLLGLPVFAGGGGFHSLLSPSFGFVVGFIPAAFATGKICEIIKVSDGVSMRGFAVRLLACISGVVVYDAAGLTWLYFNLRFIAGKALTWEQTLATGLFPFIGTDIIKLAVAVILGTVISNRLARHGWLPFTKD